MPLAPVNDGIEVFYEEFGAADDPPMLLVMVVRLADRATANA